MEKYRILEKRKSRHDKWIHYLTEIPADKLNEAIADIQENLLPELYYAHLYNEDGSDVIVIFPSKVFRLSANDEEGWEKVRRYMNEHGITIERWKAAKPRRFSEEQEYYKDKSLVED